MLGGSELAIAPHPSGCDPRLVTLVRALARRAASDHHAALRQEQQSARS